MHGYRKEVLAVWKTKGGPKFPQPLVLKSVLFLHGTEQAEKARRKD